MAKILFSLALLCIPSVGMAELITLTVANAISEQALPRYGLNLGGPSYWGAEQLRANIVRNPGFMPLLDRSIVVVEQKEGRQISDKDAWVARPDGFWTSGNYHILSGAHQGLSGRIYDYRRKAQANGQFWLDKDLAQLRSGDVLSVEKISRSQAIAQWWSTGRTSLVALSPNQFAARLQSTPSQSAQISSFFDTLGADAGRLLLVAGDWQLRFKARTERGQGKLKVRFARDQQSAFVQQELEPNGQWQSYQFDWQGKETGNAAAAPLSLSFEVTGDAEVWLDEVYLGEKDPLPGGFRRAVVETLKTLKPGFLRDWQGQLGDNVDNRFGSELMRYPIRYRPGDNESFFAYSIPEFFALCAQIDAQPWVIGPPTLSIEQWFIFGQKLRQAADQAQRREVVLEFGNENWNALFRPAGLVDVAQHQQVADAALAAAKRGFGTGSQLITVVNAPFLWGDSPGAIVRSKVADRVAVAPYFLYEINQNESERSLRERALSSQLGLLSKQQQVTKAQQKSLATYEINFHSTLGNAPAAMRTAILNNGIAGVALARQLIDASRVGLREQAVYSLAGYNFRLDKNLGDIPLFGITRDLSQANRLRPTGQALALLNDIVAGQPIKLNCAASTMTCQAISAILFRDKLSHRYAIVNASEAAHTIQIPCRSKLTLTHLNGSQPGDFELSSAKLISRKVAQCANGMANLAIMPQSLLTVVTER